MYKLPYDQITSTSIEKADVRRVLHVFPAMSPIASRRKQTLVINYTDAAGAPGTLNFELPAYRAMRCAGNHRGQASRPLRPLPPPLLQLLQRMHGGAIAFGKRSATRPLGTAQAALGCARAAQAAQNAPQRQPGQLSRANRRPPEPSGTKLTGKLTSAGTATCPCPSPFRSSNQAFTLPNSRFGGTDASLILRSRRLACRLQPS